MLTVEEALLAIGHRTTPLPPSRVALNEALGLVLTEAIASDVDSPPFDKALMDGFAVRSADVLEGQATLSLIGEVTAGRVAAKTVQSGQAIRIMTGAPMPSGADAVVRKEEARFDSDAGRIQIDSSPLRPGANVMAQGTSMRQGECVLPAGRLLRPQDLALLAELGWSRIPVRERPQVAVLATGDELVPADQKPGPGQIRNSNEPMLTAQIRRAGAEPVPLGIARDDRAHLRQKIEQGLRCDLLLLSGGVSAGKLDLVPCELEAAGVQQVFHKVRVKPGKPIWFGVQESSPQNQAPRRLVFGLPGNPVSSLVCFELFARTAIRRLMGCEPADPQPIRARLQGDHQMRGDRPTYFPSHLQWTASGPTVEPVQWQGSADLRATLKANAMALFPAGEATYRPGDWLDVYPWQ